MRWSSYGRKIRLYRSSWQLIHPTEAYRISWRCTHGLPHDCRSNTRSLDAKEDFPIHQWTPMAASRTVGIPSLAVIDRRFSPFRVHAFDNGPGARARCLCSRFRERGAVLILGRSTYHVVCKRCIESKCSKAFGTPLSLACAAVMVGCPRSIRRLNVLGPEPRRTEGWTRESCCSKTSSVTSWGLFLA